ncbi:hypothetical protein L210DRAFT_3505827 [Boletus edulis BED1]|uniref:Uncharacterized protein n=1 Tax=Boletus edulis BED1 TaxID=1328754 RepID=A0AAD4GCD6_BOLED|nr:hypothetical protein L210DRAFT_3505827 [Boletus edulis BED1]
MVVINSTKNDTAWLVNQTRSGHQTGLRHRGSAGRHLIAVSRARFSRFAFPNALYPTTGVFCRVPGCGKGRVRRAKATSKFLILVLYIPTHPLAVTVHTSRPRYAALHVFHGLEWHSTCALFYMTTLMLSFAVPVGCHSFPRRESDLMRRHANDGDGDGPDLSPWTLRIYLEFRVPDSDIDGSWVSPGPYWLEVSGWAGFSCQVASQDQIVRFNGTIPNASKLSHGSGLETSS